MSERTGTALGIIAGALPLWVLCDFYSFVIRAYFYLGKWPSPHNPDPKDLPFEIHYTRVGLYLISAPLLLFATIGVLTWLKCSGAKIRWGALTLALSCTLYFVLWHFDPGYFVVWYFD